MVKAPMSRRYARDVMLCAVEQMVKAIAEFEGLRALRLEGNTIGVEAAQTIAKALENKSDLQVLASTSHLNPGSLYLYS